MGLLTKAIAICARKKAGYYYPNNNWYDKLLFVRPD